MSYVGHSRYNNLQEKNLFESAKLAVQPWSNLLRVERRDHRFHIPVFVWVPTTVDKEE